MKNISITNRLQLQAADGAKPRRFKIEAYNGGLLPVDGFEHPVVVDLRGLQTPNQIPILIDHRKEVEATLGVTDAIENTGTALTLGGLVTGVSGLVQTVLAQDANGQTWQASIGARVLESVDIPEGQVVNVNGQEISGPFVLAVKSVLKETSILPLGADSSTSVNLAASAAAASKGLVMSFEDWVKSLGLDSSTMNPEQQAALQDAYAAKMKVAAADNMPEKKPEPMAAVAPTTAAAAAQAAVANNLAEQNAAALRGLGTQAAQRAEQIGAGANVPFTPYTVTTGLGTSQVTPTGATATAAPEYQNLRQAALQRSQEALGAINPALASQTLFGQLEALQGPARQREQEALLSRLGARGLLGFGQAAPTVGGVTRTTNPYLESLLATQAAQQAQSALAATQYGTSEAARQQALAQALQTQGLGIDEATRQQLATAGTLGLNLTQLAQTGAAREAQAGLYGLGLQSQLNLGAASVDAQRRREIAQAIQAGVGNLGGALTSAGGLLTGANALANTVGGLSAGSAFTSAPAMSGFGKPTATQNFLNSSSPVC